MSKLDNYQLCCKHAVPNDLVGRGFLMKPIYFTESEVEKENSSTIWAHVSHDMQKGNRVKL